MPQPWVLYLAFNAPHQPFHAPPQSLHTYHLYGAPNATPSQHYRAAVQAMDTEIGRLLASLSPTTRARTTIIFTADNGSPNEAVTAPFEPGKAKGTLFEGGINVPLIVSGPGVRQPGRECAHLINSVDVYPTVIESAGLDLATALAGPRSTATASAVLTDTRAVPAPMVFAQRPTAGTERGRRCATSVVLIDGSERPLLRHGRHQPERDSLLPGALDFDPQAA